MQGALLRLVANGGASDTSNYAMHSLPAGEAVHVRAALWAFSGCMPLALAASAVAVTPLACRMLCQAMPAHMEVIVAAAGVWLRATGSDNGWPLAARTWAAADQEKLQDFLEAAYLDEEHFGRAPYGLRANPRPLIGGGRRTRLRVSWRRGRASGCGAGWSRFAPLAQLPAGARLLRYELCIRQRARLLVRVGARAAGWGEAVGNFCH